MATETKTRIFDYFFILSHADGATISSTSSSSRGGRSSGSIGAAGRALPSSTITELSFCADAASSSVVGASEITRVDEQLVKQVSLFCFPGWENPCNCGDAPNVRLNNDRRLQHENEPYSFCLTDTNGKRRYGFCLKVSDCAPGNVSSITRSNRLCLVSRHPWFSMFYSILNAIQSQRVITRHLPANRRLEQITTFLRALLRHPFPLPGETFSIKSSRILDLTAPSSSSPHSSVMVTRRRDSNISDENDNDEEDINNGHDGSNLMTFRFTRPDDSSFPFADADLKSLFTCLSPPQVLTLLSCALLERRLVFCGSSLTTVSACVHSLSALMYPFHWQHVYIPVLPTQLSSYLCAPFPFIIGIHTTTLEELHSLPTEKIVIIDTDRHTISGHESESRSLPGNSSLLSALQSVLIRGSSSNGHRASNASIFKVFLDYFVHLFGHHRSFIVPCPGDGTSKTPLKFVFDRTAFRNSKQNREFQSFFDELASTQLYEQWEKERISLYESSAQQHASSLSDLPIFDARCASSGQTSQSGKLDLGSTFLTSQQQQQLDLVKSKLTKFAGNVSNRVQLEMSKLAKNYVVPSSASSGSVSAAPTRPQQRLQPIESPTRLPQQAPPPKQLTSTPSDFIDFSDTMESTSPFDGNTAAAASEPQVHNISSKPAESYAADFWTFDFQPGPSSSEELQQYQGDIQPSLARPDSNSAESPILQFDQSWFSTAETASTPKHPILDLFDSDPFMGGGGTGSASPTKISPTPSLPLPPSSSSTSSLLLLQDDFHNEEPLHFAVDSNSDPFSLANLTISTPTPTETAQNPAPMLLEWD